MMWLYLGLAISIYLYIFDVIDSEDSDLGLPVFLVSLLIAGVVIGIPAWIIEQIKKKDK